MENEMHYAFHVKCILLTFIKERKEKKRTQGRERPRAAEVKPKINMHLKKQETGQRTHEE
jgi:hypothetical protein